MKPISARKLPHTITIYNAVKDARTGKTAYHRTFLEYVRLMDKGSTVHVSNIGWTRAVTQYCLVDAETTEAYVLDSYGNRITKVYVEFRAFEAMPEYERNLHWTMKEGDYVLVGECPVVIPPDSISALTAIKPRRIHAIQRVDDKNGDMHHWEVTLV